MQRRHITFRARLRAQAGFSRFPRWRWALCALAVAVFPPAHADDIFATPATETPSITRIPGGRISVQLGPDRSVATPSPLITPPLPAAQTVEEDLPHIATIDLTTPPDDLWQRIRNGFAMPNLDSPLVADRQAWYLNRPAAIRVMAQRSRRYLHHIVSELEKRGMPTELALLPMVESAFNPMASSPAKALGIWQFIPSTGRNYNLEQNWWMDQRRDIIASTNAALDYLQNIYEMHGDWHLALASYNWGENAVAKAVARNHAKGMPTDYLNLSMPGETRYYVPKLQALKNIIADPALFGIRLEPIPNKPYFERVDMPGNMDVSIAAKLADIPLDEFIALNPAYSRPLIPDNGKSSLVIPADKISTFQANLARREIEDKPLANWHAEVLKPKERLDTFAARHGLTVARLKQINGIGVRTKTRPGMTLLVPEKGSLMEVLAGMPAPPPEEAETTHARSKSKYGKASHREDVAPAEAEKKGKTAGQSVGKTRSGKTATKAASTRSSHTGKPAGRSAAKASPTKAKPRRR